MPTTKRKKRMKLPNGFGSIKYLGSGRRNPYAVYPPVEKWSAKGPVSPPALGYKETWEDAYELLTTYNLEKQGKIKVNRNVYIDRTPTFAEVYDKFYQEKYENSAKKLSESSKRSTTAAYKNCSVLHSIQMGQIKYDDLQSVVNGCTLKHSSIELIILLMHQMYRYAIKYEIVDKDYSQFLYNPKEEDDESGEPFSDQELAVMWENKDNDVIQMLLIMCYSGFRIRAFRDMTVNLDDGYFQGGIKTAASKNRIVPIHSAIYDMVCSRHNGPDMLGQEPQIFRERMYSKLKALKIDKTPSGKKHTPHDCRHTFSMLCERYGVNENDRKRMMGHSFGSDITNAKYGHRTVDELRAEIEKIKIPRKQ